jgi:hypothetical protein
MRYLLIAVLFGTGAGAKEWEIKRNPFVVSKSYIDQTGKHYLLPKDTYGFLEIDIQGVFYKSGVKYVMMKIGERGYVYMKEGEQREINTADLLTKLQIAKIEADYVLVSINEGEPIRYEIK